LLTASCAILYWIFGMTAFDALCHSMSTVATAGLMNYDESFGHYNSPALELVANIFMISGAIPFLIYYKASANGLKSFWKDSQIRWFFYILAASTLVLTAWLCL